MLAEKLLEAAGNSTQPTYIEDVFSTYLYTGNGGTQQIVNGIDLSTKGGLIWTKSRSNVYSHALIDTVRGGRYVLQSNTTSAPGDQGASVVNFNTDGYTWTSTGNSWNNNLAASNDYVGWTFRKQPKFFTQGTYTGNGSTQAITHDLGSTPGCVIVKNTTTSGSWIVWHSGLTNGYWIQLNGTGPQDNLNAARRFGNNSTTVNPTSTTITVGDLINTSGDTWVYYAFASNAGGFGLTGTDNVISCGSFTTDGSGNASVTLGYEPQWVLYKPSSTAAHWTIIDTMRGFANSTNATVGLYPNLSNAEGNISAVGPLTPTATGFSSTGDLYASATYIYIAIRRGPMKVPTDGTKVFAPNVFAAAAGTQINTGFPVDMQFLFPRDGGFSLKAIDRLRGVNSTTGTVSTPWLATANTAAETNGANTLSWNNTGFQMPTDWQYNLMSFNNFRRAPSFFDEVCYTGDGTSNRNVPHNLGIAPELVIIKVRSTTGDWLVTTNFTATTGSELYLDTNQAQAGGTPQTYANLTLGGKPTATNLVFGYPYGLINTSGSTYVAYLFATCAGVSKVGSYTGNGSSQTINCGFTGGARFVLIKRTDSTGDWYVWDTARGIVSGNDPHLSLNTTAAEVTTDDTIDPDSTGFIVNQLSATNVNVSSATYIYLAIA